METRVLVLSLGLAGVIGVASVAAGQHEGHQAGNAAAPSTAEVTQCRQVQPVITELLNASLKRLEDGRLTNSAAAMRDAADDVQTALVDMRTQLEPCGVMQATTDAPVGHAMPATPAPSAPAARMPATQPGAASSAPAAADPHAAHATSAAPPTSTSRTPAADPHAGMAMPGAARPAAPARGTASPTPAPPGASRAASNPHAGMVMPGATRPSAPAATSGLATPSQSGATRAPGAAAPPTAGAGHAAMAMSSGRTPVTALAELKCESRADPRTTPRVLYEGRMYYFCSVEERAEFVKSPEKYVNAPASEAAPTHGH